MPKLKELFDIIKEEAKKETEAIGLDFISLKLYEDRKTLEVLVTKDTGVDIDEITKINNHLSKFLDTLQIDDDNYFLEVSSLGIDDEVPRELIKNYQGFYLRVKTNDDEFSGRLVREEKDKIILLVNKVKTEIKLDSITKIILKNEGEENE